MLTAVNVDAKLSDIIITLYRDFYPSHMHCAPLIIPPNCRALQKGLINISCHNLHHGKTNIFLTTQLPDPACLSKSWV